MEAVAVKIKIDQSMAGKTAWILTDPDKNAVSEYGEMIAVKFNPGVDQRSIKQNNLYWKVLEVWCEQKSDNPEYSTKEKCHVQVRWAVKFIDKENAVHIVDKNGNSRLYFELKSISFAKRNRKEANAYYDEAFQYIADDMGITVDELIAEAQDRMKQRRICKFCGNMNNVQGHHKLSQTKLYRELYPEYIDHPDNKIDYCVDCHDNRSIENWSEKEFCEYFGIEIRSKSGRVA